MSVTELLAGMERFKITVKHIASRSGLDRRTVKHFLESGETRSLATEAAILSAYRDLERERSQSFADRKAAAG